MPAPQLLTKVLLGSLSTPVVDSAPGGEVLLLPHAQGIRATAIRSDVAGILVVAAGVLLIAAIIGLVLVKRARRQRRRPDEKGGRSPASLDEFAIGHLVEEGRRFLALWQERIERLDELQGRLTAMAQEINQLRAQVSRIDELRAENHRLSQEGEALLLERDHLRSVLARIGELIQRVSETRPGPAGGKAAPGG